MPCGRMSIASRSRSCDLRASVIAASVSARVRATSAEWTEGFGADLPGFGCGRFDRTGSRVIGARFFFFGFVGRIVGINRPVSHSALGVVG